MFNDFLFYRVFRELKMMRFFKHENVLSCLDILQVGQNKGTDNKGSQSKV